MRFILPIGLVAAVLGSIVLAAPAAAQRVFVAAQGSDGNPCTFSQPCRTFQHAHDTVAAGGEIDVLDPAGYGSVNISKSISIQGHGFAAISVASGGTAVTIAGGVVNLAGLLLDGAGNGATGISITTGAQAVTIAHTTVRGFTGNGIDVNVGSSINVVVSDSSIFDIGNIGIQAQMFNSTLVLLSVIRTDLHHMTSGIVTNTFQAFGPQNGIRAYINDCEFSSFSSNGIDFSIVAGVIPASGVVHVNRTNITQATGAAFRIQFGNATAWLYQSTFTDSAVGVSANTEAVVNTLGNNEIRGNTADCNRDGGATACSTALTSQAQD